MDPPHLSQHYYNISAISYLGLELLSYTLTTDEDKKHSTDENRDNLFITRKILQLNLRTGRIWPTKNNIRITQFRSHPSSGICSRLSVCMTSRHTKSPVSCWFVPGLWVTTSPLKTCQKNVLPLPYTLKTVVAESSKTVIIIYHTTRCHIPEKPFSYSQQVPQISHDTLCN
jgi:hypothetical protein